MGAVIGTPSQPARMTASPGWFAERTMWAGRLTPLRRFIRAETGGAAVLIAAALAGLVWANAGGSYQQVWDMPVALTLGEAGIHLSLREWVNSGLMTFFFFVIGLEARREFDLGDPAHRHGRARCGARHRGSATRRSAMASRGAPAGAQADRRGRTRCEERARRLRLPPRRQRVKRPCSYSQGRRPDEVRRQPADGHRGGRGIARHLLREDRDIRDAQPLDTADAHVGSDDIIIARPHRRRPDGIGRR
jgi:Na+/H+ antiporter 1